MEINTGMRLFLRLALASTLLFPAYAYGYDLNNDTWEDLVFSSYENNAGNFVIDSYIYWGSSTGYSTVNRTGLPTLGAKGVSASDLNGDSYADLIFSNYRDANGYDVNSYIYWGSSSGYSTANRDELYVKSSWDNAVADLNGDSYSDIVFTGGRAGIPSYIYWGSSSGYSDTNRQTIAVSNARDVEIADFNGDNRPDIFFEHRFSDGGSPSTESYIYWGRDTGFSDGNRLALSTTGALGSAVADLNKDGRLEIIVAQYNNGTTFHIDSLIFWGDDTNPYTATTPIATVGASDVTTADLDDDGFLDIIFSNQHDDDGNYDIDSFILWGDETYAYTEKTMLESIGAGAVAVTDVNKDYYPDIVIGNAFDDEGGLREVNSYVYLGDETATYTTRIELPTVGASELNAGPFIPQAEQPVPEPLSAILVSVSAFFLYFRKRIRL